MKHCSVLIAGLHGTVCLSEHMNVMQVESTVLWVSGQKNYTKERTAPGLQANVFMVLQAKHTK